METITIPGQTISKKNSKRIVVNNGQHRVLSSVNYQEWEKLALHELNQSRLVGRQWRYPLQISFHFFRKDKRSFDFNNLSQGPLDVLQQAGIIEDDDMNHVVPAGYAWSVDKARPRVVLMIRECTE